MVKRWCRAKIGEGDGVRLLITLMSSTNDQVLEHVMAVLRNISASPAIAEKIALEGGIANLIYQVYIHIHINIIEHVYVYMI